MLCSAAAKGNMGARARPKLAAWPQSSPTEQQAWQGPFALEVRFPDPRSAG